MRRLLEEVLLEEVVKNTSMCCKAMGAEVWRRTGRREQGKQRSKKKGWGRCGYLEASEEQAREGAYWRGG